MINESLGKNTKKNNLPEFLMCNEQPVHDKAEMCSVFNDFFVNIGPSLTNDLGNEIIDEETFSNIDFNPRTAFLNPITALK